MVILVLAPALVAACGCNRPVVQASSAVLPQKLDREPPARPRQVRATGTIQAVRASSIQVPQITGQNGRLTLVRLIPNGAVVKQGDLLAEFDRTPQMDAARDAQAKYEDLAQQVKQKDAENLSKAEKRTAELRQAEADLAKAHIELRKGPILSDIDRLKNEAKAESAVARVESLKKIAKDRTIAEAAALRVLQLQMERQKVALDRAKNNSEKLVIHAPLAGMVALENIWRQGSMGHAQEGDQLYNGQPLLKIFDPGEMEVRAMVGEPDGSVLHAGATATVYLDAYPDAVFHARFHSASPVATSAIGSPIKNFTARFRLDRVDPRLLPDLSAALIIENRDQHP
jgi:HlyD family secretion protein